MSNIDMTLKAVGWHVCDAAAAHIHAARGVAITEAGYYVEKQERDTRNTRCEELDDDFACDPNQLDRDVVTPCQIRTIVRSFRDKLFTEIFPSCTEVPRTRIFAKGRAALKDPFNRMCA